MPATALKHRDKLVYVSNPLHEHGIDPTMRVPLQTLAQAFVKRSNDGGLIGFERDRAALDFWAGAAVCAAMTENGDLAQAIGKIGVLDIALRGYPAVVALSLL